MSATVSAALGAICGLIPLGQATAVEIPAEILADPGNASDLFSFTDLTADSSAEATLAQVRPIDPPEPPPSQAPLPLPELPPEDDEEAPILISPDPIQDAPSLEELESAETFVVERFEFAGNTIFSDAELSAVVSSYIGREITLDELFEVRTAITQRYVQDGYQTSGAILPPQRIQDGVVQIQVIEGQLTDIVIEGNERLSDRYVRRRVERGVSVPINVDELLESLRLLQLDPRIENLRSELSAGPELGTSLLTVEVVEAETGDITLELDNNRSPSVGSFRQQVEFSQLNLAGGGETFDISYARTDGSNDFDGGFELPLNPMNATFSVRGGATFSEVIEPPFDVLNIESDAHFVELSYRQPVIRRLDEELALGVTFTRQGIQAELDIDNALGGPIPLAIPGADDEGRTRVSALRFFQDWTKQWDQQAVGLRSQFSFGFDAFNSTVLDVGPDSRFFAWRGQAQYVRRFGDENLLVFRADAQFADNTLVTLERFGVGGQSTVRGYRQDLLLTDNGFIAAAEARFPVLRARKLDGVFQVTPFLDVGTGWNVSEEFLDPDPETLVGIGLGLQWRQPRLTASLEWGIPLVSVNAGDERTWQENGIYFSVIYNPF